MQQQLMIFLVKCTRQCRYILLIRDFRNVKEIEIKRCKKWQIEDNCLWALSNDRFILINGFCHRMLCCFIDIDPRGDDSLLNKLILSRIWRQIDEDG